MARLDRWRSASAAARDWLGGLDTLPRLTLLAAAAGFIVGVVIVLFRLALDAAAWLLHGHGVDELEALPWAAHLLLPVVGALGLGIVFGRLPADEQRVGVSHVMERLARHEARMSWRSAWRQFYGALAGLVLGLSGGREGPAVHLGAAASGLLGSAFNQPQRNLRTLIACGSAAAIAASFNTPLAGVIFAMEVVLMEYTIVGFVPVIVATVVGTVVSRSVFGGEAVFVVPETALRSLLEAPYIVLVGLAAGVLGGAFIRAVKTFARLRTWPFWLRATTAGAITGGLALFAPAALGIGYDTVNTALLGNLAWTALLAILVAKTIATAACVGVGLPIGIIAPTLVMGAMLGGLLGVAGNALAPGHASEPALYVMLGMAAMMAAVLQAPLAALVAVLELTANPNVILPAMLVIVVAKLVVSQAFKQRSVFLDTLAGLNIPYPPPSIASDEARGRPQHGGSAP